MPPKAKINKEKIITCSMDFIRKEGIAKLNARSIAKYLNCSTQPIFSIYQNMEMLKKDIYQEIVLYCQNFIMEMIDKDDYLFTISLAYEEFARLEKNYFEAMFLSELHVSRTMSEIINTKGNRETMIASTKQYHISLEKAEELYRDVRFYTHGITTQVYANSIDISKEDVEKLIRNAIKKFLK